MSNLAHSSGNMIYWNIELVAQCNTSAVVWSNAHRGSSAVPYANILARIKCSINAVIAVRAV